MTLEDLREGATVRGILPNENVMVVAVKRHGENVLTLTYRNAEGRVDEKLVYRDDEPNLETVTEGRPWSFDADGALTRLVAEAKRISLAHLFDPYLAVHTSNVEPLPHQITAVYEKMLQRQPLRFLLADDPGAGKTIMAGLYIKELMLRGDLERCLVVCPGMLVEQWQDELLRRFHLEFDILTRDMIETSRTGNPFLEKPLLVARLDHLSRNEMLHEKLDRSDWDLIIVDEAHKLSASWYGNEVKYTKRYRLGERLRPLTRHFLLMTATPHNGKELDFQLFMQLLDEDRFEGKYREDTHVTDASDMMRRMIKEGLVRFDGTPLFPERCAYTVPYKLSEGEASLYTEVTDYVTNEFNRADALDNDRRKGNVGFALTILQRRLASSPEAIYQSLRRRKERLEFRLEEERIRKRAGEARFDLSDSELFSEDDLEDLEDSPEVEDEEEKIVDGASAAQTIAELEEEIRILVRLEALAKKVRQSGTDCKWEEVSKLLQDNPEMLDDAGNRKKLVVFTEHRDTLHYLEQRVRGVIGRNEAVVSIHGGMAREVRRRTQEEFTQNRDVLVLLATDAAGEGINLQRAHLMINYDLPWNPNRLEQRFGRIHRIGQDTVCHLWNLVAVETREGDVYKRLLDKLTEEAKALKGQVFDVLGKLSFDEKPLRQLMIEAIRYGNQPDVRDRLNQVIDHALDHQHLVDLIEEHALAHDVMDVSRVQAIREEMDRAEARKLQPHHISTFFREAFQHFGGRLSEREPKRWEVRRVPADVRNRAKLLGGRGEAAAPFLSAYERITFEKDLVTVQGKPLAELVCPGHPLLDATVDLVLERYRDLMRQGAILIDEQDDCEEPRALVILEHAIQDARTDRHGNRHVVSKRLLFAEITASGDNRIAGYAPYLDYRPLTEEERSVIPSASEGSGRAVPLPGGEGGERSEPGEGQPGIATNLSTFTSTLESTALSFAIEHIVPTHLHEVRSRTEALVDKAMAAVKDRLTKEIAYWDHRANELKEKELAGKNNMRLNSGQARRRAEDLEARLKKRMTELEQERQLSPLPPVAVGGALILPIGLLRKLGATSDTGPPLHAKETAAVELAAMNAVMKIERDLGYEPRDVSKENLGYDIESRVPGTGTLRFIEVKGRTIGADTITVTRNEILTALNKPESFILAIVEVDGDSTEAHYLREPFDREPDFTATSVNFNIGKLLQMSDPPLPLSPGERGSRGDVEIQEDAGSAGSRWHNGDREVTHGKNPDEGRDLRVAGRRAVAADGGALGQYQSERAPGT